MWEINWRRGQTAIWPEFFFDHSSTSASSWLGLLNRGSLRAQPSVWSWFSLRWHPVSNWLPLTQAVCALVILLSHAHLLPLFFRLFTQVHLLIDSLVEGQSITVLRIPQSSSLTIRLFRVIHWTLVLGWVFLTLRRDVIGKFYCPSGLNLIDILIYLLNESNLFSIAMISINYILSYPIYQPLRSGRIWHKVNF